MTLYINILLFSIFVVGDGNIKVSQIRDRENGASHITYTSVLFTTLLMFLVTLL